MVQAQPVLAVTAQLRHVGPNLGKYSGTEIKIDGEDVLILREDEVLAALAWSSPNTLRK